MNISSLWDDGPLISKPRARLHKISTNKGYGKFSETRPTFLAERIFTFELDQLINGWYLFKRPKYISYFFFFTSIEKLEKGKKYKGIKLLRSGTRKFKWPINVLKNSICSISKQIYFKKIKCHFHLPICLCISAKF